MNRFRTLLARLARGQRAVSAWFGSLAESRWNVISGLGWCALAVLVVAFALALVGGWVEAMAVAIVCGVCLIIAILSVVWRSWCQIHVHLPLNHTVVGATAVGELKASNATRRRTSGGLVELPVGQTSGLFRVPSLPAGGEWSHMFTVPTRRRGVIIVGPARSLMVDPLGFARRQRQWSDRYELWVNPRTVRLQFATVGFQADIEGETTQNLVSSDISFHALRDYVPGDDMRHIHWPTSARTGELYVRQFQEARRSHHVIMLDTHPESWTDDAFETGVSAAASLGLVGITEGRPVSVTTGTTWLHTASAQRLLDELTEVELDRRSLSAGKRVNTALADRPEASALTIITGPKTHERMAASWATQAGPDIATAVIRITPGEPARRRTYGGTMIVDCPTLEDLPTFARREAR